MDRRPARALQNVYRFNTFRHTVWQGFRTRCDVFRPPATEIVRILHLLHSLDQRYGGPLRAVLDLSARSISFGLDSEVLGFGPCSIPDNPLPSGRIHQLPLTFPKAYGYSRDLRAWLNANLARFDGVIVHGMWLYPNWEILHACRKAHVPYICFPHGMLEPWALYGQGPLKAIKKTIYWFVREREVFRHATAVFFTTERERRLALETFSLPPSSFIVVPYGVDRAAVTPDRAARADLDIPAGRSIALFLGRVHQKKNVDFLIKAWASARPDAGWQLVIAGPAEPQYGDVLKRLASNLGVQDQVRFVGAVSGQDKSYLLSHASWFLLPSKQENFGISVLEAINSGCPVAISDQVYLADELHKRSEILPLRQSAWIEFIRTRMQDEQHRRSIVAWDQKYLIPKFSVETVTRDWVSTITDAFGKVQTKRVGY